MLGNQIPLPIYEQEKMSDCWVDLLIPISLSTVEKRGEGKWVGTRGTSRFRSVRGWTTSGLDSSQAYLKSHHNIAKREGSSFTSVCESVCLCECVHMPRVGLPEIPLLAWVQIQTYMCFFTFAGIVFS